MSVHQWTELGSGADRDENCDVCVIGTGCGGASLAARLAERGRNVVLLERGGYYTKQDFDQREVNMLAKIDGGRGLSTSDDGGIAMTYGNNVGGASVHYWADSYRLPADRLQQWEQEFGLQGHGADVLGPHFSVIERDLNVHPAGETYVNRMNALLHQGAEQLGWHVAKVPQARKACVASGHCMQGCAYDAKQSQLVTYIPRALRAGARLYADTRADRFVFSGRRATRLDASVIDRATGRATGRKVRVNAKAYVVAAGGFATPELLLRQNLPTPLPALGANFFCNPCPMVHALFDEDITQWRNIPAAWGVEEFRRGRYAGRERVFGGEDPGAYVEGGYLLMANQLHPGVLAATLPGMGAGHTALIRQLPRLGGTIAWIDDIEGGRISVTGDRRRIHVPLNGGNGERIRDAFRKQARLLLTVGARQVLFGDVEDTRISRLEEIHAAVARLQIKPGRNVFAAPHPGGGARMGHGASDSVVGHDHRVHGTDNLYVADPSVFPSPPSVDPSLTIMAFSFVAADVVHGALG